MIRARTSLWLALALLLPHTAAAHRVEPDREVVALAFENAAGPKMRGDYFWRGGLVAEQVIAGIGVPEDPVAVGNGLYLISGCRAHSCSEKAAILARENSVVVAAALVHFRCRPDGKGKAGKRRTPCDDKHSLTIFRRNLFDSRDVQRILMDWAYRLPPTRALIAPKTIETRLLPH
jgi:hypothetical protein